VGGVVEEGGGGGVEGSIGSGGGVGGGASHDIVWRRGERRAVGRRGNVVGHGEDLLWRVSNNLDREDDDSLVLDAPIVPFIFFIFYFSQFLRCAVSISLV